MTFILDSAKVIPTLVEQMNESGGAGFTDYNIAWLFNQGVNFVPLASDQNCDEPWFQRNLSVNQRTNRNRLEGLNETDKDKLHLHCPH